MKLLELIRERRKYECRTLDGYKPTNKLMHHILSNEIEVLMKTVGAQNKTKIRKECKERGVPVPNFKEEV